MVDIEREIGDKDVRVTVKDLHLADPKLERVLHVRAERRGFKESVAKTSSTLNTNQKTLNTRNATKTLDAPPKTL